MSFEKFLYQHVTLRVIKYPRLHRFLRFWYDLCYRNTPLSRDHRLKQWALKSNKLIRKHGLAPVYLDGKDAHFINNGVRWTYITDGKVRDGSQKFLEGEYEPEAFNHLAGWMERKGKDRLTILDIGANVGLYSLGLAQRMDAIGKKVTIYAFEPVGSTFEILQRNCSLNSFDIHPFRLAMSDKDGAMLMTNDGGTGNHLVKKRRTATERVKTARIDTFVKSQGIETIDAIKCDVEGAELFVLKGGLRTIKKHRPLILLEINRQWTERYGYDPSEIIKLLLKTGYTYRCAEEGLVPGGSDEEEIRERLERNYNFIFEPR